MAKGMISILSQDILVNDQCIITYDVATSATTAAGMLDFRGQSVTIPLSNSTTQKNNAVVAAAVALCNGFKGSSVFSAADFSMAHGFVL